MMKTNNIVKKLPVWVAVSAAVALVGLLFFFLFGFHLSDRMKDRNTIVITYDSYINIDDALLDEVEETCLSVIDENSLKVEYTQHSTVTNGGAIEFTFSSSVSYDTLVGVKDNILAALENSESQLSNSTYEGAVHVMAEQNFSKYIVRASIALAGVVVLSFVYVAIRFKLASGITVAVLAVHDVALVVALTLIARATVSTSFVAAVAFALVYSLVNSCLAFADMRRGAKNENVKALPEEEAEEVVFSSARRNSIKIAVFTVVALALLAVCTVFVTADVLLFVIPAFFAVVVSLYSSCVMLPSLYRPFKAFTDRKAEERAKKRSGKPNKKKLSKTSDKKAEKSEEDEID